MSISGYRWHDLLWNRDVFMSQHRLKYRFQLSPSQRLKSLPILYLPCSLNMVTHVTLTLLRALHIAVMKGSWPEPGGSAAPSILPILRWVENQMRCEIPPLFNVLSTLELITKSLAYDSFEFHVPPKSLWLHWTSFMFALLIGGLWVPNSSSVALEALLISFTWAGWLAVLGTWAWLGFRWYFTFTVRTAWLMPVSGRRVVGHLGDLGSSRAPTVSGFGASTSTQRQTRQGSLLHA